MGYQINTTWTELRRAEIERLNEIIDNEYYNELEIARKLRIMTTFEKKLEEAIEDFNFDVVIEFMKQHNWKWAHFKDGKSYMAVTDKEDIIDSIKQNFFKHALFDLIELNKKEFSCSTGGLVFFMGYDGDWCDDDSAWLTIYFDIANYVGDDE